MKDLYSENYKTLMKEIEDYTKNAKKPCVHELEKLILLYNGHNTQTNLQI